MNAQEVVNKNRDRDQRFKFHVADDPIVFFANSIKRIWSFIWCKRRKKRFRMPIRVSCADIVLHILGLASHWVISLIVQNLVQLENVVSCNRNSIKVLMNDIQRITIPRDLFLTSIFWSSLFGYQLPDTSGCCPNSFNSVRCLRTLYLCYFDQFFKFFRPLL